jgi:hypothetical protein
MPSLKVTTLFHCLQERCLNRARAVLVEGLEVEPEEGLTSPKNDLGMLHRYVFNFFPYKAYSVACV